MHLLARVQLKFFDITNCKKEEFRSRHQVVKTFSRIKFTFVGSQLFRLIFSCFFGKKKFDGVKLENFLDAVHTVRIYLPSAR